MKQQPPRRRPTPTKRQLLAVDLRQSTPEDLTNAVQALLETSSTPADERVHVLASALVMEALRPYWTPGRTPQEAHEACAQADPELARMIEAIAPTLLERVEVRATAREAISDVERLLGL
ncbi:MAG: hypothetical protein WD800_06180 [Dehalococcoidia bacterium]